MRSLDKNFRPHLEHLFNSSFNGSFLKPLQLREEQTSAPAIYRDKNVCDHFKLHIPYAGYVLVWEVRFDSNCPEFAPDFLFDDEAFTSFLTIDMLCERVPSLENWDTENPECLTNVIQELLNLYTLFQLKRLEKDGSPLSDECSKLVQEFELKEDQIQVLSGDSPIIPHHYTGSSRPPHDTVSILFLQVEKLLNFEEILGEMALQFNLREFSPNAVLLHMGPVLRNLLGGDVSELEVPSFSRSEGLSSYFGNALRILRETFNQENQSFEKRKEFHLGLRFDLLGLDQLSVIPIENDVPDFTTSSYRIEVDKFCAVLIVRTPRHSTANPRISLRTLSGSSHDVHGGCLWDLQVAIEAIMNSLMDLKAD